uniref:THUMP domain containing 1 n=1 Tax=Felis catus TaxID=9685 RepID=A0ABI7WT38_FELCA
MAAPVQQPPRSSGGKRKGKAQCVQAKGARRCDGGGPPQLEPGLQGLLITCNMNQRKCVEEAYSLLNEYDQQPSGSEAEDDDVEAALKKEVGGIKASTEMKLRRFQSVESGANNVVFIRTLGIEPEKLEGKNYIKSRMKMFFLEWLSPEALYSKENTLSGPH